MACVAGDAQLAIGKLGVDLLRHPDHLARHFLRCASRSARSSMRNLPNWNNSPTDWLSSTSRSISAASGLVAHKGFAAPAPFRGLLRIRPADVTTSMSTP